MSEFPQDFGRYQLLDRIAVGGMAEIFHAQVGGEHGFEKAVVIKRILPHLGADEHFTKMFIDEAKITGKLVHPKIAQTYELGRASAQLFIAMEYVDGLDTLALLRECAHRGQRVSPRLAVYIVHEVLDALDFAHKQTDEAGHNLGIVHRDVSPSNILLSRRGDVKLIDFGIARAVQREHNTKGGTLKGKYGYMSPEQVVGGNVTAKSDLFAAGIVLAELLMGRRLFAAPNELDVLLMVRDVNLKRLEKFGTDIAPDLYNLIHHSMRKSPVERFEDAAEFRDALGDWMYSNKMRVTPSNVAELVAEMYDGAMARQKAILAASKAAVADVHAQVAGHLEAAADRPPASPPPVPKPPSPPASAKVAAAPAPPAAPPAKASPPAPADDYIDLTLDDDVPSTQVNAGKTVPAAEGAPAAVPQPVQSLVSAALEQAGPVVASPDSLIREGTTGTGASTVVAARGAVATRRAKPITAQPADHEAFPATSGSAPKARLPVPSDSGKVDQAISPGQSSRFESIEAAVASVSIPSDDPASRDFDDADVTSGSQGMKRKLRAMPPSAAELADRPLPRPPTLEDIGEEAKSTGDFKEISPIRVLFGLCVSGETGLLVAETGSTRKEVYFVDGQPEFVTSNVPTELFGNYLVGEGVINAAELDMALAMLPQYGGKLGDTLVGLGLVRPLDIFRHLGRQVRAKLLDLCTWPDGVYSWYPGKLNTRDAFSLDFDRYETLGAGALALTPMFLTGWLEEVRSKTAHAVESPPVDPEQFQVGAEGREIFDSLDGSKTVQKSLMSYSDPRARGRFLRLLYLFVETNLVQIV